MSALQPKAGPGLCPEIRTCSNKRPDRTMDDCGILVRICFCLNSLSFPSVLCVMEMIYKYCRDGMDRL